MLGQDSNSRGRGQATAATVTINEGTIVGKRQSASEAYPRSVDIFYGIPYATAERFQPARSCVPVTKGSTFDARTPGPSSPFPMAQLDTSESPLRLNIIRPSLPSTVSSSSSTSTSTSPSAYSSVSSSRSTKLPVMIYIHGGAFNFGYPLDRDLASLVSWAPQDVLVVGVSHRLGALGFLSGDESVKELNLGLRDQRVAMEWVRRWVGAFGGDGEDITLMGVSAGAHAIGHHMLHPTGRSVRKAILESGSPTARSVLSASHPRPATQFRVLRKFTGNKPLADVPLKAFLDGWVGVWAEYMVSVCWPFQPVVDGPGGLIPDTPINLWREAVRSGRAADMSVIVGFCSHEGTQFVPQSASTNTEFRNFFKTLIPAFTDADLDTLEELYPDPVTDPNSPYHNPPTIASNSNYGPQFTRLHSAYAHQAYICPVLHTAHAVSGAGRRVYVYEYAARASPFDAANHGDQGSIVAHEMAAMISASDSSIQKGLVAVADEMNSRWVRFAASPTGDIDELWPRFISPFREDGHGASASSDAKQEGQLLVFGDGNNEAAGGSHVGVPVLTRSVTQRERDQCRFWWDRMELSQGMGVRDSRTKYKI